MLARLALIAVLLLATSGAALAQPQPVQDLNPPQPPAPEPHNLRGSQAAIPDPVPTPPEPRQSDFPLTQNGPPRLGGLEPRQTGGAACRTACASRHYACLARDDATTCGSEWALCLSACPELSGAE